MPRCTWVVKASIPLPRQGHIPRPRGMGRRLLAARAQCTPAEQVHGAVLPRTQEMPEGAGVPQWRCHQPLRPRSRHPEQ